MASYWEKVTGSRNRITKASKSLFIKTEATSRPQHQFKVKWQWSNQTRYQKTLKDISSALEFYDGIRIAIPSSKWDKKAMQENSLLLKWFLENKLAERAKGVDSPLREKNVETSRTAIREKEIKLIDMKNKEKTAA